tara:strand:+ start:12322 stop:14682 length:2361 start_codon:yes stop_codon:yes gene_type:complete
VDQSESEKKGTFAIRIASGQLFLPDEVGSKVDNLYPSEEGTLRTVEGPLPYLPNYTTGGAPASGTTQDISVPRYGYMHGVFQATVGREGEREVLLVHTGTELWEFQGWSRNWRKLIGSAGAVVTDELISSKRPNFPTQFESTQDGIVIVPQNSRAYFYDGTYIAPLGYTEAPGAPVGLGPENSAEIADYSAYLKVTSGVEAAGAGTPYLFYGGGINDSNYAWDALQGRTSGMIPAFRYGRLGFTRNPTNLAGSGTVIETASGGFRGPLNAQHFMPSSVGGWLEAGEWRCAAQYIDCWGNLSPLSGRSNPVTVAQQYATDFVFNDKKGTAGNHVFLGNSYIAPVARVRKQVAWTGLDRGPARTVGRILYRTADLRTSGTAKLFRLTQDALEDNKSPVTLPDNVTEIYPDNIPDVWLGEEALDIDPVPTFRLCRVAFGRLWIANMVGDPGLLQASLPGRWGTFSSQLKIYPDPRGSEITALWRVPQGLLAFTEGSTYLIVPNDTGDGFTSLTVSSEAGCPSPNSVRTLKTGEVLWMGADGFYKFSGTEDYSRGVEFISTDIDLFVQRITQSRRNQACAAVDNYTGEYRCWASIDGNLTNNTCFIYDGTGWRTREDVFAKDVCVTQDHRNYMLAVGEVGEDRGLWVVDHESVKYQPAALTAREATVETAWLTAVDSEQRRTAQVLYLWLRETENTTITIEVMRDWRNTVIETTSAKRYSGDDIPKFWSETPLGSANKWQKKRPYWTRAAVYVPSAEVFKFRIRGTGKWEFVGIQLTESPRYAGGARIPP